MYLAAFALSLSLSSLNSLSFAQTINPTTVDLPTRQQWCTQQKSSCPLLCLQYPGNDATTIDNSCDATTLDWSCVCANGIAPNASEYSQTIPYFECTEYGNQCVANCNGDSTCQTQCRSVQCGAKNPTRVNLTTVSTSMSSTAGAGSAATDGGVYTILGGGSSGQTNSPGSGSDANGNSGAGHFAFDVGRSWGLVAVLGSVFAGVVLVL